MDKVAGAAVILAFGLVFGCGAAGAGQEHIGGWVLSCPDGGSCLLRAEKRFLDQAGIVGELEVLAEGRSLVPVVALRGLSDELLAGAALAGRAEASMQLSGGAREKLACEVSAGAYICSPRDEAAGALAAGLPGARSVTVRVSVVVSGLKPLPVQEKSLELTGTREALVRLRAAGPAAVPGAMTVLSAPSAGGLVGAADRALKAAGYPNGVADLQGLMAKYRGK